MLVLIIPCHALTTASKCSALRRIKLERRRRSEWQRVSTAGMVMRVARFSGPAVYFVTGFVARLLLLKVHD